MSTQTRLITADQLWRMPDRPRCELLRGELHTMAPAGFEHGAIIARLSARLANYVESNKLGVVLGAETGFVLKHDPDTVRGADVSFVRTDRLPPPELAKKFFDGPPDLAVEVLSPDDSVAESENKVDDYLAAGTRLVWVVNPRRRTVVVHTPNRPQQLMHETDTLTGENVVPGFQCKVADIFA